MKKINVITLGCSKEHRRQRAPDGAARRVGIRGALRQRPHRRPRVVINTCGFIGDAKKESIDMILRAAAAKQAGKIERLFVVGCLSERYADELRAEIPEVDDYFGARMWGRRRTPSEPLGDPALATERLLDHAEALRLPENFRRLQLEMRLLRHSAHPRPACIPCRWRRARRRRASSPPAGSAS